MDKWLPTHPGSVPNKVGRNRKRVRERERWGIGAPPARSLENAQIQQSTTTVLLCRVHCAQSFKVARRVRLRQ